ncbi:MAG: response regulator [Myxococcales bacterium]|nr:response regulator [Myxococcales bacterium]
MYNVVVIEDDFINRELVGEQFEEVANVRTASNGQDGLELVRHVRPDLVVLDLNMPVMNGFDFLTALRAQGLTMAVVVVTAMDLRKDDFDFLQQNSVARVFQKGRYSEEDLLAVLHSVVGV